MHELHRQYVKITDSHSAISVKESEFLKQKPDALNWLF